MNIDLYKEKIDFLKDSAMTIYGVDIMSPEQTRHIVWARMAVSAELLHKKMSLNSVGRVLNKTHCTILHYKKRHIDNLKFDSEYRMYFQKFKMLINIPSYQETFSLEQMREKALEINEQFVKLGYDWDFIENFWIECFKISKANQHQSA